MRITLRVPHLGHWIDPSIRIALFSYPPVFQNTYCASRSVWFFAKASLLRLFLANMAAKRKAPADPLFPRYILQVALHGGIAHCPRQAGFSFGHKSLPVIPLKTYETNRHQIFLRHGWPIGRYGPLRHRCCIWSDQQAIWSAGPILQETMPWSGSAWAWNGIRLQSIFHIRRILLFVEAFFCLFHFLWIAFGNHWPSPF